MKPIELDQLPVIYLTQDMGEQEILKLALRAVVDGQPARIFLRGESPSDFNVEEKIVIIWETKHEVWPNGFITKYFYMDEPGKLNWGHDGEFFWVCKAE